MLVQSVLALTRAHAIKLPNGFFARLMLLLISLDLLPFVLYLFSVCLLLCIARKNVAIILFCTFGDKLCLSVTYK